MYFPQKVVENTPLYMTHLITVAKQHQTESRYLILSRSMCDYLISGHEPQTGLDTKTDRLTDRQL
jgi:hypothetical protein